MNKVSLIKTITKLYFLGAVTGSAMHIVHAAEKTGLTGAEAYATPFMIDGLAIVGLIMRGDEFSAKTRRLGAWTQGIMGMFSLIANVYAAETAGGVMFGVAIVSLFLAAEFLSANIESVQVDLAAAAANAAAAAKATEDAKRADQNAKARARRAAKRADAPRTRPNRPLKAV